MKFVLYAFSVLKKAIIPGFILLFIISACSDSPDKKIRFEKLVMIYADVLIVSSAYDEEHEPDRYFEQLDSVLAVHGVNRESFDSTLNHYQQDPARWKELLDNVIRELETRRDQVRDSSGNRSSS